ncbi:Vitamin B12 dependent methionine synthase activation domain fused to iron-sulfur cluster [Methanonatronarchaeum thermophilum]|uniref:Vitamin B12 dependent methionine synthase activation domain fused to iron-sulfur cluster n=1 Tax=Methanonatronarchaeum thermophilum TaxID=1927129 RepID=A0A1Y3GB64_9EURY|nr:hypothetical protein [Methanonatronarchaeum thermophilum]OUJ18701.1 Vitamin B12 dependent methionine synthase activation domain fused to iron-sulfur cluster [Methanonatronarchaeum thermophilum]
MDIHLEYIYENIDVDLDIESVVNGPPFTNWVQNKQTKNKVLEVIYEIKDEVFSYIEPRSVQKIIEKQGSGIDKYSPPKGLLESEFLAIGVVTIGDNIYKNPIRQEVGSGQERMNLDLLVCDALENIVLDKALREVCLELRNKVKEKGLNTTRVIPPGSGRVDWGIENQEFIFNQIDAHKIGVKLENTNALSPQKTLSFVLGLGQHINDIKNIFSCKGCPRTECPYRAE